MTPEEVTRRAEIATLAYLLRTNQQLRTTLEQLRDMHHLAGWSRRACQGCLQPWPCDTRRLVDTALTPQPRAA